MSNKKLSEFFGFPNLKLVKVNKNQSKRFFEIHLEHHDFQSCKLCNSQSVKLHQWRTRKVKDSPIRGKIPILYIKHKRMMCLNCKKTYTETIPGIAKYGRVTERMQREILYACDNFKDHKRVRKHTTTIYTYDYDCYIYNYHAHRCRWAREPKRSPNSN